MKKKFIPYAEQWVFKDDIEAVVAVMKSNRLTCGPKVEEFEDKFKNYVNSKYAIAISNGTMALYIAVKAITSENRMGTKTIFTSPISFVATTNCIVNSNNVPYFIDIRDDTFNIDPTKILNAYEETIFEHTTEGIISTDMAGLPCDWQLLKQIADKHDLFLIEDACHALGSEYLGHKTGSCKYSDMTVFSFHPVKHLTSGEGAMITTNDQNLADTCRRLRNHGFENGTHDMIELGYNARLTDVQCAMGITQLKRLNFFIERRRKIAQIYNEIFRGFSGIKTPTYPESVKHSYHLYILLIDFNNFKIGRKELMGKLHEEGIGSQLHYFPIPEQKFYKDNFNSDRTTYRNALKYYEQCLSIPMFPKMSGDDVVYVGETIKKILKENRK